MSDLFYTDINFDKHEGLIVGLESVRKSINYDRTKVDKHQYKPGLSKEYALHQCSSEALEQVEMMNGGDRQTAHFDCNILKFDNFQFEPLRMIVAASLTTVLKNISQMGLSGRTWYPPEYGYM